MAIRRRKKNNSSPLPDGIDKRVERGDAPERYPSSSFPIVGVGASAGGIEAFTELLHALPDRKPEIAFVLVQHQDRHHASMLAHILSRATKMEVVSVTSDVPVEPDTVYVAPAEGQLVIEDGVLRVVSIVPSTLPIDNFLRSLAEDQGSRAIGVVLSGAASDGSAGTRAIKAEGGITFAQDESAKFDSMPKSAIASGAVDFILSPKLIAQELVAIAHSAVSWAPAPLDAEAMAKVFTLLQKMHGVDFSHYKPTTIGRRVRRRMAVHKMDSLSEYLKVLQGSSDEVHHLYGDILIRVTGFFRDPEVFEMLKREVFPNMIRGRDASNPVRLWVPGCATGEEVYSLAISLLELASEPGYACPIQIFGTDISDVAIDHARAGVYAAGLAAEVSPERLQRFFTRTNGSYRISKAVRDCCIFARQDVTRDPPFSKLDLISCRNVMIYLSSVLQRRIMSIFQYALRPGGYLLLGSSETIGSFGDMFSIVDRKHKLYQKQLAPNTVAAPFEKSVPALTTTTHERTRMDDEAPAAPNVFREADRVMMTRYAPPGVLINEAMEILQFRGKTSPFLEPAPGMASLNLLKMAREGLLAELRAAILNARKTDAPVRREDIRIDSDGATQRVNVEVIPFVTATKERYQLVLFEQVARSDDKKKERGGKVKRVAEAFESRPVQRLKRELDATREYLQSIIEEQEAMNEELRSANEEIQSSNEELQSTNEELETAKEELQSTNEELITLNEELENRNQELGAMNSDLMNVLTSVDIPVIMLDNALRIRRFNPGAERALNLGEGDVGRPLGDLKAKLQVEDLDKVVGSVIGNLDVRELEVQDRAGKMYSLRIRPYKTTDNKIEGAVLLLTEKNASRSDR